MAERLEELLGVEEVAEYLGVGQVTVYRWCSEPYIVPHSQTHPLSGSTTQ